VDRVSDVAGITLSLDASTYDGSVAVLRDGVVVAEDTIAMRGEREERLMPAVAAALNAAGAVPQEVQRIVCGEGPGSFTSLRIAAAIAKGLASAITVPVYGVSSLVLAAVDAGPGRWFVTLDAMRGDVYAAAYAWDGATLEEVVAQRVIPNGDALALAKSAQCELIQGRPHARAVEAILAAVIASGAVDLASWEPSYGRNAEAQVKWEAAHGRPLAGDAP
jgi:tRNA threonylcarbamoyladenosine biosynthesis protein TsaB